MTIIVVTNGILSWELSLAKNGVEELGTNSEHKVSTDYFLLHEIRLEMLGVKYWRKYCGKEMSVTRNRGWLIGEELMNDYCFRIGIDDVLLWTYYWGIMVWSQKVGKIVKK